MNPAASNSVEAIPGPVLFFDEECGLCNRCVRLLLRMDRNRRLRFAPLQGPAAQSWLRAQGLPTDDFDSMILVSDWSRREQSSYLLRTDAVLEALHVVGGGWRTIAGLRIIPVRLRDVFYRGVARCRHVFFGEWKPRPLPCPEWAERFLT